ncbi:fucolectin-like [Haliotis rubra]|uniref:fucolectin-like n=1 Tax=Haliotis rubra TaxID=36100 RepID=UPI001EE58DC8|nr:fucolectin-like [Haliotis rubra]
MDTGCRVLVSALVWALFLCFTRTETNLALNRPTSVSSSYSNNGGSTGNDGNSNGHFGSGSCFASQDADSDPWWQVDLQANFIVKKIEITNRQECCPERLHSISLELFDEDPSVEPSTPAKLCYFISDIVTWSTLTIRCTRPVTGRYLRLTKTSQLNLHDLLQFCEVKVYGGLTDANSLCASFVQTQGSRYDGASNIIQGPEINSSIACAVTCERLETCIGFNIRYNPEVACVLVQNPDLTLVQDAAWDFYLYKSCASP